MSDEEEILADYDASDAKTVNNARKKEVRLRQRRVEFVRSMMEAPYGRLWVGDLLIMGHHAEPTHTPGDPYSTAYKEGERNIINRILYDINEAAPNMYVQMLTDMREEK